MDEIVKIIKVETGGSTTTVKELKNEINSLRDALLNTEKGSEEYNNILKQLIDDQVRLTDAMRAGQKEATAAEGSYNALVNKMAALKKVWRETTDEVKRKEIGKEIKSINDDLKKLDASIGDFRRTVGDYTNSITSAFGSMGGAAKGMIGPINGVKTAFSALSSHPLIAVLTGLAALLINGISKGFKSSEENMNKLRVAFSGFKAIGDAVVNLFQGLAGWIAKVAEGAMNLADKLGLVTPKMKERQELTKKQIELEQKERKSLEDKAKLEKDSAELRAKAADKETYTTKQRIEFLKEAQAKDEEILGIEKDILVTKLAQAEAESALTGDSSEEKQKIAELKAQVIEADAKIQQSRENANRQLSRMYKEDLANRTQAITQTLNLEKELIQQEYDNAEEGSEEQLRLAKELRTKELEIQQEGFKAKIKNRKDYEKAMRLSIQAYNQDIENLEVSAINSIVSHERDLTQRRINLLRTNSVEYYQELKKTEEKVHNLYKSIIEANGDLSAVQDMGLFDGFSDEFISTLSGKTLEAFKNLESESLKALMNISDNLTAAEEESAQRFNQIVLNGTLPLSKYLETQTKQLKDQYDNLIQKFDESDDEFKARKQAIWKNIMESESNYWNALLDEYKTKQELYNLITRDGVTTEAQSLQDRINMRDEAFKILLDQTKQYIEENKEEVANNLNTTVEAIDNALQDKLGHINLLVAMGQAQVLPEDLMNSYIEHFRTTAELESDILEYRKENWSSFAKAIGELMGSVADVYDENLKAQVKNGKMSQEEAEKEFDNTVKPMRIAEATINTINGALAAFMGWQDKGQPFGAIMGAIQAASVTAAGIAQIKQIEATKFGGGGSGSINTSALAQVTPIMPDFAPEMTGTLTGQQETEELANAITSRPIRAYVVESDITSAQELANQRFSESTF